MTKKAKQHPSLNIIFHPDGDDIEFDDIEGLTAARLHKAFLNARRELNRIRMKMIVAAKKDDMQRTLDEDMEKDTKQTDSITEEEETNE